VAEKQKTEIDAGLLEELRHRAREQSRTEGELLEEIVRRYLVLAPRRSDSFGEFFDKVERRQREEGVEPLSEEEAMQLANEELHAMRAEARERKKPR
jgi:predicted metallo-beta-lactamase superfamily hydrolase